MPANLAEARKIGERRRGHFANGLIVPSLTDLPFFGGCPILIAGCFGSFGSFCSSSATAASLTLDLPPLSPGRSTVASL